MKITLVILVLFTVIGLSTANAQVGIGTKTPAPSAVLDLTATDKGFLPPRLSTADRDAISSPVEGLTVFNTDSNCFEFFQGSLWYNLCEGGLTPGPTSDCSTPGFIPPFLPTNQTVVKDVTNLATGNTWMDRNLGAYTADRSTPSAAGGTDCWAYGNLYQWGRGNDGHESRTSSTAAGPVAAGTEGSNFITNSTSPFDWLSTRDDARWNANETAGGSVVKTANDPCPAGYRVPTDAELQAELDSWGSNNNNEGAINSPLKLPVAGFRRLITAALDDVGLRGNYWSSSVTSNAVGLNFNPNGSSVTRSSRSNGLSVRCIKD